MFNDTGEDIRDKARELTKNLTQRDLPIRPLKVIGDKYNIKIFYEELYGEEGFTLYRKDIDAYRIYIDDSIIFTRRNFTVMHEVAHIVLGHCKNITKKDADNRVLMERLDCHADIFASEFLLPDHLLRPYVFSSKKYISSRFGVSQQAINMRMKYLESLYIKHASEL